MKPSEILDSDQNSTFWDYLESMWLYPPWILGSSTLLLDSIFFFIVNVTPFFIIFYSQIHIKKYNNQNHVSFWCCLVIRSFQQILTPIMAMPMTFRLSYLIEQIFIQKITNNLEMTFSFLIAILNIILHLIHTYFASLFLIPIDFVVNSKADFYDGKNMTFVHFIRIITALSCFMFSYMKQNSVVALIMIGVIFLICFATLFLRLSIQVHVSPIGQYLEILPFFICPFMILFRFFIQDNIYSLLLLISLYLAFAFLFSIYNHFMVKQSLKAFSSFLKHNNNNNSNNSDEFCESIFTGSAISIIRIVAAKCSDPDCLLEFLKFQKKSSELKNSFIIEVVRFLALFPSRRKDCLKEFEHFHSHSNFNQFTVFIFKKILKSLNRIESTEKNLVCLNNFYRSYLVHKHLFWTARKNKKYFVASKEAFTAAYYFIEVKNEFHYLMKRYTFDSFLHYYYADFCLSACGDFESYLIECQIGRMLDDIYNQNLIENNNNNYNLLGDKIVDPLLHPMSIINPKILQFCSLEEKKINLHYKNKNEFDLLNSTSNSSNNNNNNNTKLEKSRPVATFLNEKKYLVPLLSIFHFFIPICLFLYVMGSLYIKDQQIHSQSIELYNSSLQLLHSFYIASSMVYIPYLTFIYTENKYPYNSTVVYKLNNYYKLHSYYHKNKKYKVHDYQMNELYNSNNSMNYNYNKEIVNYNNDKEIMNYKNDKENMNNKNDKETMNYKNDKETMNYKNDKEIMNYNNNNVFFDDENYKKIENSNNYVNFNYDDFFFDENDKDIETFFDLPFFAAEFFSQIQPLGNLTGGMIFIFEQYISNNIFKNYTIKQVLNSTAVELDYFSKDIFHEVYIKIEQIKKNAIVLREIYKDDLDGFYICKVSIVTICIFSVISCVVYIIQINCIYRNDEIKIDFLSSIQLFSLFLFQESKKAWELLRKYGESSSNDLIDIIVDSARSSVNLDLNQPQSYQLEILDLTNLNQNLTETNSSNETQILEMTVNGYNFNNDVRSLLNSNNYSQIKKNDESSHNSNRFISSSQEDTSESENQDDEDYCNQAIEISKKIEKKSFLFSPSCHLIVLLLAPLVFTAIVISMFQIPLIQRAHDQEERFQNILVCESFANHSLIILNGTFDILEKRSGIRLGFEHDRNSTDTTEPNSTYFETYIDEILSDLKWYRNFYDEKCYEFLDIVCMSVERALNTAIDRSTEPSEIALKCIPFIYLFTWNLFNDLFLSSMKELTLMKVSNGVSFIVATILLMLTFVHLSFSEAILLRKAFNSLFHFPDDFLKTPIEKPKDNSKSWKEKVPQNALIVTSITDSDEIYSVSDNSKIIINRNLNDLVTLKMSEIFKKVPKDVFGGDKLCEFSINDKKKKIFRYSTENIGCLTKTIFIEENSRIIENTEQQSCTQKLHGFIPPYFTELYVKNDQYEFNFVQCFIICVRISDTISSQLVEKCFNAANHISQNSISINIIGVDGDMIVFSSISKCKLIVILLLIRDFIDAILKSTKVDNCIYSIYVQYLDNLLLLVVDDEDEPYLNLQPFDLNYFKFRLFQIGNGKIAFTETTEENYPLISEITDKLIINVDFDGNFESLFTLPINQLASKIVIFV